MIIKENIENKKGKFIKQYSDLHVYIQREGVLYEEAIDPIEFDREYEETDIPIEDNEDNVNEEEQE